MKVLVVVDMQYDFVYGSLKNEEAQKIVPNLVKYVDNFDGEIIYTKDTHHENYLETQEGKKLPVKHCILGSEGHNLIPELNPKDNKIINKPTFGSIDLACYLEFLNSKEKISQIELVGVCTDICVIANAIMIKSHLTEVPIIVHSSLCAGVTPKSHENALEAMKMLQIEVR